MLIGEIPLPELVVRLRREGVHLNTGAFTVHLHIEWPSVAREFATMYASYPIEDPPGIDDATVRIGAPSWWRRHIAPLVLARCDGVALIDPVPVERGFAAVESALNWGLATSGVAPLIMHAAVLERNGRALLMPAPSGSGKSTLSAALAWRGWRLFSDEMAVFGLGDHAVLPNPRPVSLKNEAIELIRDFEPRAIFSPTYRGTHKGDVAYMRAPDQAVARASEAAPAGIVLVPSWRAGAPASLRPLARGEAFRWLVDSTVNYASMLSDGFGLVSSLVENCRLYSLTYSELDDAIELLGRLADEG